MSKTRICARCCGRGTQFYRMCQRCHGSGLDPQEQCQRKTEGVMSSWYDDVWNPVVGCTEVSEGCKNCCAVRTVSLLATSLRTPQYHGITKDGHWTGMVRCLLEKLGLPLQWEKPLRILVGSLSDIFHPDVPNEFIAAIFGVAAACPQHTFIISTKRPERAAQWFKWVSRGDETPQFNAVYRCILEAARKDFDVPGSTDEEPDPGWQERWPLPNVWLLTSVEDQLTAEKRIPWLFECTAAVLGVSYEPALGPADFAWIAQEREDPGCLNALTGEWWPALGNADEEYRWREEGPRLDWVRVGGEWGPEARPCHIKWIRSVIRQCQEHVVPCWVDQIGRSPFGDIGWPGPGPMHARDHERGSITDFKGSDPSEWPKDLQVQELPKLTGCA